jgi:hypothetical protein
MSYGFMAWAVDTKRLEEVCGSKDGKLFRRLAKGEAPALRQIIDGTVDQQSPDGASYYYAFQTIVAHFGRSLDNGAVYPWWPDDDAFDAWLKKRKIPLSLWSFMRGLPNLPRPDDFPRAGMIDAATVKKIDAAFTKADLARADEQTLCIRDWFREAAKAKRGIVAFYY